MIGNWRVSSDDEEFRLWYAVILEENAHKNENNFCETRIDPRKTFTRNFQEDLNKLVVVKSIGVEIDKLNFPLWMF